MRANRQERNELREATKTLDELTAENAELRTVVEGLCNIVDDLVRNSDLDDSLIWDHLIKIREWVK